MRENDDAEPSGNTAQFRAFVDREGGPEGPQPWEMNAPGGQVLKLTGIVLGVAVLLAAVAFVFIG